MSKRDERDEVVVETTVEETSEAGKIAPVKTKKSAKKTTVRSIEDLHNASVKSMSEAEMVKYITELRDELALYQSNSKMLGQNCRSAYEKVRVLEDQMQKLKQEANTRINFAKDAMRTCYTSILLATTPVE